MKYFDIVHAIDWTSIKLTGFTATMCAITFTQIGAIAGIIAAATTIIYNGIRIYKELRKTKQP